MIRTNEEYELVFASPMRPTTLSVVAGSECLLSHIVFDVGDGYRPLVPRQVTYGSVTKVLPIMLPAGTYVIDLSMIVQECVSIMIVGYGLQTLQVTADGVTLDVTNQIVTEILATVNATITSTVNAAVASGLSSVPGYYEGDGHPANNPAVAGAINGSRYYDRIGRFKYDLVEGEWEQRAS